MTIETVVNKTIQSGNGSNKDFDFAFEIPDEDSLSLTKRGSDGTETAITTNFTVTGIGDEAGGSVNYPTSGSALTSNEKIIIKRVISLKQLENLRNQGDYSLEDIEDALDRAVMMCQQLQEQIDRCLKLNLTSSSTYVNVDDFVANRLLVVSSDGQSIGMSSAEYGSIDAYLSTLVAIADDISAVAAIDTEITAVAGIETEILAVEANETNINIVAGIDTEITTVAGIAANITSVAGNTTNINTVAEIAAAITSVAAITANVSTVAGIAANVTTVAGMSSSIASVVANMTSIQNAASFGFPTLASGDEYKMLQIKADRSGYNAIEAISRRNAIINGNFNIWQRATSFSSVANGTYVADRWIYAKSGAAVHDISRSTDVPSVASAGRLFNYSVLIDCTTADTSIASGDFAVLEQRIEGYNWVSLAQKTITLSFWVKGTKTGIHCVYLKNSASDRSYVAEYTINTTNTWEYKTVTISASPSAGTWDYTTGIGIAVGFVLYSGSTYQTTKDAWQTGGYLATSSQSNACDSTSNDFRICGVQLEIGSLPTPFESLPIQNQIQLCQRYFEKSYNLDVNPGSVTNAGQISSRCISTAYDTRAFFKTSKRTAPTIVVYNPATGSSASMRNESASTNISESGEMIGTELFHVNGASGVSNGDRVTWHYTADAEL